MSWGALDPVVEDGAGVLMANSFARVDDDVELLRLLIEKVIDSS